jgi:hypothetical protein
MARMFDFDSTELMIAKGSLERWKDSKDRERMLAELQEHGRVTNYEAETVTGAKYPCALFGKAAGWYNFWHDDGYHRAQAG